MNEKFTVNDGIVTSSLLAVGSYNSRSPRYRPVVIGGMAIQLYTFPHLPSLVRPTTDVDLTVNPRMTKKSFKQEFAGNITGYLRPYNPTVSVLTHVYEIKVEDPEKFPFVMHAYKFTINGFERNRPEIERVVSNASNVWIPNSSQSVPTVRPEDIVYGKVDRLRKIFGRGNQGDHLEDAYQRVLRREWEKLAEQDLDQSLETVVRQKRQLPGAIDRGQDEFMKSLNQYRSSKDIFDISLLARLACEGKIEFDERYYDEIIQDIPIV